MSHEAALITTITAGLGLALVFGFLAVRLRLPALIGYLAAGIAVAPTTPGFVADASLASQLAEIGVILLMFGVGLHFSLQDLLAVKGIAIPGALLQIAVATLLGAGLAKAWGWSASAGIVFGLSLSVASTVVLLKALEARGELGTIQGRIAVGWLVVEDLATVLVLVLLPPLAGLAQRSPSQEAQFGWTLLRTLGGVAGFVALMLIVGRRLLPWVLWQVAKTASQELFTLCVIAVAMGIAFGSAHFFGVSFALGAFFAGMVLRESSLSHRAAEETLPLRDAFSVLFFVSVGMLFDPSVFLQHPLRVLAVLAVLLAGKSLAAFGLVLLFRYPLRTALTIAASLAQIGEFSFILAALGISLGLMPREGMGLVLAGALLSIALNPLLFRLVSPAEDWIRARLHPERLRVREADPLAHLPSNVRPEHLSGHAVLIGYGNCGREVRTLLEAAGILTVTIDANREIVETLRGNGAHAVAGDGSDPATLVQAHLARAKTLVISLDAPLLSRKALEIARVLNPRLHAAVRCEDPETARLLERDFGCACVRAHALVSDALFREASESLKI